MIKLDDILKFIDNVYTLKVLTRYNNKFKVINESVAEHMYFVSLVVLKLSEYVKFDLQRALVMAIIHDLTEIDLSDVTHDVKTKFPDLAKMIENKELLIFHEKYSNLYDAFLEFFEDKTLESNVVHLADVVSCIQYSRNELKLCNNQYMTKVEAVSLERVDEYLRLIEEKSL